MAKYRALIVDDEPLARQYLRNCLDDYPQIEIIAECGDGRQAVSVINEIKPDLLFLDMQMPEWNGLQLIEELGPDNMPLTIFVTAYDRFAIKAFDIHAVDYLLKPFNKDRFATALERALSKLQQSQAVEMADKFKNLIDDYRLGGEIDRNQRQDSSPMVPGGADNSAYLSRVSVKTGRKSRLIKVEEIDWIEASDDFVSLHCSEKKYLLSETMQRLEKQLDPSKFVRIHRGAIVNLDRVAEFAAIQGGDYEVILFNRVSLRLSRRRKPYLESILGRSL